MNFGVITENDCINVVSPPDPRCQDPAFALANPTICPPQPILILKPGAALVCALGSIQFSAFFSKNGIETDVTTSTIFACSDENIAVIGAISGNATGLTPGTATISAVYQGLTAYASLDVIGTADDCCGQESVAMQVVIDNSRSMSQAFSAQYPSRLDFVKAAATRFINEVNATKDLVGLDSFNAVENMILHDPTSNKAAVAALIGPIPQSQQKTAFYDAINTAIIELNTTAAALKVIVLMSDGEDSVNSQYTDANNPTKLTDNFKAVGGIVICLGARASGKGFGLLSAMATGGFFINGLPTNAQQTLDYLSGLKGYICAGNCVPEGDTIVNKGQLDYSGFINWDVVDGTVDLQGNGFFDFLPGHGLYVDLAGTTPNQKGKLVSKTAFPLLATHSYRLSVTLSGNQRVDATPESVRLRVFYLDGGNNEVFVLDQKVTINDYTSPFTPYSFTFTATANVSVNISIQQEDSPPGGDPRIGLMLDEVNFSDSTNGITLLDDNFDAENPTFIPPRCGPSHIHTYVYGYNCYGTGCLDTPPGAQMPDPSPLPDIESGFTPPKEYTSTKTVCAKCPTGTESVSLANLVPVMTSDTLPSGQAIASGEVVGHEAWHLFDNKLGPNLNSNWQPAANGVGWAGYMFPAATSMFSYRVTGAHRATSPADFTFEGSNNGVTWTILDSHTGLNWYLGEAKRFDLPAAVSYQFYRVNVTALVDPVQNQLAIRKLELFVAGPVQICSTKTATSFSSQADADSKASAAAMADALSQLRCATIYSATEQFTASCESGCFGPDVTKSASATSLNSLSEAQDVALAAATAAAQAALDCTGSNNTQKITINDAGPSGPQPATPYPSVQFVTGLVGHITKVTVTIKGFHHDNFNDVGILLRSPSGTVVELMRGVGGHNTSLDADFNLVFDDDAANSVAPPSATTFFLGGDNLSTNPIVIYRKPTQGPSGNYPPPAPQVFPFFKTMAAFIGEFPNGCWSLWVCDFETLDAGYMLFGFDILI